LNALLVDNGVGDVSVRLPAGLFPSANTRPSAHLNDATGGNRAPSAEPIANGARVRLQNSAGAADLDFTLELYGA
jgi:hypothetical protein